MISKTVLSIAGAAGAAFIGYCIYFDHKRRSDPNFKEKLRESKYEKHVHQDIQVEVAIKPQPLTPMVEVYVFCLFWPLWTH